MNKELQQEIEERKIPGDNWLNNFHGNLPGGYMAREEDLSNHRKIWKDEKDYTELKRGKTVAEFFIDCKNAAKVVGITPQEQERLWRGTWPRSKHG